MEYLDNVYIHGLGIILVFWIASYVITFLMGGLEKLSEKTETDLDDRLIHAAKRPVRYLAVILGFYLAVQYVGFSWEWNGVGVGTIFFALLTFLVGYAASRVFKALIEWYIEQEKKRRHKQTMFVFARRLVSVVIYSIALMLVLNQFGIEIGPLLAGMGVAGIAIALGLQEPLSNLFSAMFIVMDKSVNVGDWIRLEDGTKAFIEDISWRSVRIRTKEGNSVIVPNASFVGQKIASYDYPESSFETSVKVAVAYDSDLQKVEDSMIKATKKVMEQEKIEIVTTRPQSPRVRFRDFGENGIHLIVRLRIGRARDEGRIKHFLIKEIDQEFRREGIVIPYPQRVIHNLK